MKSQQINNNLRYQLEPPTPRHFTKTTIPRPDKATVRQWLKLRREIGTNPAARQLGYQDRAFQLAARDYGLAVPKLNSSAANAHHYRQKTRS